MDPVQLTGATLLMLLIGRYRKDKAVIVPVKFKVFCGSIATDEVLLFLVMEVGRYRYATRKN